MQGAALLESSLRPRRIWLSRAAATASPSFIIVQEALKEKLEQHSERYNCMQQ